jgi:hypothetical protein
MLGMLTPLIMRLIFPPSLYIRHLYIIDIVTRTTEGIEMIFVVDTELRQLITQLAVKLQARLTSLLQHSANY